MLDLDNLTNNNTDTDTGDFSLESILAEYSDFDAGKAAERETVSRSRQIVYEALGETSFSGGLDSVEADDTVDAAYEEPEPEPEYSPAPAQDYYRTAGQYTHRLRRSFERFGRHVNVPAEDEYTPEPAGEPDFAGDDDVKVYRPAHSIMPDGDEDVKIYGGVESVIAEAERRSARWSRPEQTLEDFPGSYMSDYGTSAAEAPGPDDYAGSYAYDSYGDTEYADESFDSSDYDVDGFSGYDDDVREYGYGPEDETREHGYASPGSEDGPRRDYGQAPKAKNPILAFLAVLGVKLRTAQAAGEAVTLEDEEELGEELPAKKAAKYYAGNVNSLRVRFKLSILPMLALLWVSLGLPAFGALGSDLRVTSLACLVMQLAVVMLGLDVFTSGIMSLVRGRPGLWSLVSAANIAAALDAAVAYAVGEAGWGYPMCAAAALSMFFAVWGALLEARALRFSCKAQELSEDPMIVTAENGVDGREGTVLLKSSRSTSGWLRRCEEPDAAENAFSAAAPWILLASLLLAVAATAVTQRWTYFFRVLAAVMCAAAPASAFIACPLPYFLLAIRSYRRGAAVAGWPGMRDIGRSMGMVITDTDLFPGDSVKISSIRILDGAWPEKIIANAGSVIIASGSGLAVVFADLMRRNGYAIRRVEDFCCHEGGGLTALIAGEEVLCGSAGFMRLMGIMVPQKLADKSAVFIAVSGVLSGIFSIEYTPVPSVGRALQGCLRNRRAPIFAVRDFLVTPLMLHKKYRVPAEGFDFPLFAQRYAVSATEPAEDSPICALLGREGLGAFMEVSGCGRRCYLSAMLGTTLSAVGAVVGVILAFALYAFGSGLTVSWLIAYMALFAVPGVIASLAGAH